MQTQAMNTVSIHLLCNNSTYTMCMFACVNLISKPITCILEKAQEEMDAPSNWYTRSISYITLRLVKSPPWTQHIISIITSSHQCRVTIVSVVLAQPYLRSCSLLLCHHVFYLGHWGVSHMKGLGAIVHPRHVRERGVIRSSIRHVMGWMYGLQAWKITLRFSTVIHGEGVTWSQWRRTVTHSTCNAHTWAMRFIMVGIKAF